MLKIRPKKFECINKCEQFIKEMASNCLNVQFCYTAVVCVLLIPECYQNMSTFNFKVGLRDRSILNYDINITDVIAINMIISMMPR